MVPREGAPRAGSLRATAWPGDSKSGKRARSLGRRRRPLGTPQQGMAKSKFSKPPPASPALKTGWCLCLKASPQGVLPAPGGQSEVQNVPRTLRTHARGAGTCCLRRPSGIPGNPLTGGAPAACGDGTPGGAGPPRGVPLPEMLPQKAGIWPKELEA